MRPTARLAGFTVRALLVVAPALAGGQSPLYENGPLVTHPGAGTGGADVSAVTPSNSTFGFGFQDVLGNRLAEDLTVGGTGWTVSRLRFFGYQTGSTTTSTFTDLFLQVWDAAPGTPGATVLFGDLATNRLTATGFTGIYRAPSYDLSSTARPIMYLDVDLGVGSLALAPGTYWVDWTARGTLASGPWAPPISYAGTPAATGNARQETDAWRDVVDGGSGLAQGLPFEVHGSAAVSAVPEPATVALLATGLLAVGAADRRRRATAG